MLRLPARRGCTRERMAAVLARIHLDDMGSPSKYRQWGLSAGLSLHRFEDRSRHLAPHYSAVCRHLEALQAAGDLAGRVSPEFVARMRAGLQAWVEVTQGPASRETIRIDRGVRRPESVE